MWLSGVSVVSHQVSTQQQMSAYQNIVFIIVYSSECTVTWPAEVADWANRCKNLQNVFFNVLLNRILSDKSAFMNRMNRLKQTTATKIRLKKIINRLKKNLTITNICLFRKALLCWISSRAVIYHASSNCFFSSTSGGRGIDYLNYYKELLTAHETVSV